MTHLGTLNISYGQKKGQKSNCQFNRLDLLACRWQATYRWKVLDEGYNFFSNLTSIGSLNTKLWASKVEGVLIQGISKLPTWESRDKMTFGCHPMAKHKKYYKEKGGGFPQVRAVVSLVSMCLLVAHPCTKSVPTMH